MPTTPSRLLKGVLFALTGLAMIAAMVVHTSSRLDFLDSALQAEGNVVALNAGGSHPEIAFTDDSGARISYPQGGWIYGYQVGMPVKVYYRAEAPETSAVIDDFGALWGTSILLGLLGSVFMVSGLLTLSRRTPHESV